MSVSDHNDGWEFPPHVLRGYALLADGERGILAGPRGDFVWMCAPHWDSDAVFYSLIGGHGIYAVSPVRRYVWGGFYEAGSLIWRSRWTTETGIVECREALAFPGEPGRAVVLRRIIACDGPAKVRILLDSRAGFGRHPTKSLSRDDGVWTGRCGSLRLRWTGGDQARPGATGHDEHALAAEFTLAAGEHHDLVLELSEQPLPDALTDPDQAWTATEHAWAAAVPDLANTIARSDARHSYAVLRGLTSSGGGMVAAATMSLPERAEQGRNYDYRYVWVRDQCFTGQAIAAAGAHPLLDDAVRFVAERLLADGPQLKPAYTVTGGPVPDQRSLDLAGYPGGHDITGNHVNAQFQLDAFGETLLLLAAAARADHLDADGWKAAEAAAAAIASRWSEPEAGIWELDARNWTESRLICVAGLRAISAAGAPPAADRRLAGAGREDSRRDCRQLHSPHRPVAARPRRRAAGLSVAVAADPGCADRQRPTDAGHPAGPAGRAGPRQLPVPVPPANRAARRRRGGIPAVRLHHGTRAAPTRRGSRSDPLVRTQPGRLWPTRAVFRGIRHHPTSAARDLPQAFVHALMFECAARLAQPWKDPVTHV